MTFSAWINEVVSIFGWENLPLPSAASLKWGYAQDYSPEDYFHVAVYEYGSAE